ncbi:glycogen debranching protein GlgX [Leptolyngbya sp. PCC 6406]|uniref:glycogen debranching protein GlgX n=1 Tax=Leptolyngbya sp. PCC 6406 TaxID=1173264 RepID=UPI0002AC497D|nr:glycogen debranching protein GlgX [Leptolyngbya sp. PCC 6406]
MTPNPWPGSVHPLGATWDGAGTNFALFSENATAVELCLFDDQDQETRMQLPEVSNYVWHGYLPGIGPGQRYGFRVYGAFTPEDEGHRFNPHKLLLDPYANAIAGDIRHDEALFSYPLAAGTDPHRDLAFYPADDATLIPKCVVINPHFDWGEDAHPQTPWHQTVIYETHVRGFTQQHPDIPEALRGTYAGLGHPAAVAHLKSLGITAIELLPVHHFNAAPGHLANLDLHNYWGYDSLGYFAPYGGYSASGIGGDQVREFKAMVKALHAEGIEVILDVVYNHTGEGNHFGPTLTFRGIDNAVYYRLVEDQPRYYMDFTGCGNSLNVCHPQVLKLIMDSLRYWVLEMHVDGFRFDLASALARELYEVNSLAAFFDIIHQDPVLSTTKLIAEPWDLGEGGYQVGNFPLLWSEWNGQYRDTMRDFWREGHCRLGDFALRLTGSPDLYESNGKRPHTSINFITCHDGFTLRDLVSYNEKHNEANGEDNRDGESYNRSWNCGIEGETDDPLVQQLRLRQQRNFLATLLLSQGVPMLLGGDEFGRTQGGNNNTYCQDNELSWLDWTLRESQEPLLTFTQKMLAFRSAHPVFCRRDWFQGRAIHGSDISDIGWYDPEGNEIGEEAWQEGIAKALGVFLNGSEIPSPDLQGNRIIDDSFLLFFNAQEEAVTFTVAAMLRTLPWYLVLDTKLEQGFLEEPKVLPDDAVVVGARSLVLLQYQYQG